MAEFADFQSDTAGNNVVIQRGLREIDTEVLITALMGLTDDLRQMVYRNVSRRVRHLCIEGVKAREGTTSESQINAAQEVFLQLLNRNLKYADGVEFDADRGLPEVALDSDEEVISTFKSLVSYVRKHGVLPLQTLESGIDHPVMKKGIELLVDGTEPLLRRSILERYRDAYLQSTEARLDMILDGIDSLGSGDFPEMVETKLKGFIQKA